MFHYLEYRVTAKGEKALSHGAHSTVKEWKQLYLKNTLHMVSKVWYCNSCSLRNTFDIVLSLSACTV